MRPIAVTPVPAQVLQRQVSAAAEAETFAGPEPPEDAAGQLTGARPPRTASAGAPQVPWPAAEESATALRQPTIEPPADKPWPPPTALGPDIDTPHAAEPALTPPTALESNVGTFSVAEPWPTTPTALGLNVGAPPATDLATAPPPELGSAPTQVSALASEEASVGAAASSAPTARSPLSASGPAPRTAAPDTWEPEAAEGREESPDWEAIPAFRLTAAGWERLPAADELEAAMAGGPEATASRRRMDRAEDAQARLAAGRRSQPAADGAPGPPWTPRPTAPAKADDGPRLQVRIGRLEVSEKRGPAPLPPSAPDRGPRMPLGDYLQRRRAGRH